MNILSKIKNLNNKKVLYPDLDKFAIKKIKVYTSKRLTNVISSSVSDLIVYDWLLFNEYENFLQDFSYEETSLDSFYKYYEKNCINSCSKPIAYKEIKKAFLIMKKNYWEVFIEKFFENSLYKRKAEDEFKRFLENNHKGFLVRRYENDGKEFFDKAHKKFLYEKEENDFGLKNSMVGEQLEDLLNLGKTGDGSFLYKWELKDKNGIILDSGIDQFKKAANSGLYKKLKENEMKQREYIFDIILRETNPKIYKQIKNILSDSKFIAELGPGGTDKLLQVLKIFYENNKNKLSSHFTNKMTKFLDLDESGYIGIKEKIKDHITKDAKIEGSTGDMKESESSVYSNLDKTSYFMFGGTIGNFSLDEIGQIFDNMNTHKRNKSNNAFITYFTEPKTDKEKALAVDLYSHKEMENFILSGFEALGFPKGKIKYIVKYKPKKEGIPGMVKIGAEVISDLEVISPSGKVYKKKKGDIIWAVDSFRFGEDDLKAVAKKHNFDLKISSGDQKHMGVAAAVFESKGFFLNDKFKKPRGIIYGALISSMLLGGGGYFLQKFDQNSIQNKIKDHKKKMINNKSLFYVEYLREINSISQELAEEFISIYGTKNLTYETIRKEIALYLKDFSEGNSWLNEIKKAPNDIELKDMFLADFVEKYFYGKMFENGFDNLEPEPFLKGIEKDMIETLQYNGPVKEGYNEKDGLWYIIHAPRSIYSIIGSDNEKIGLMEGYIVPHQCEFVTIKVPEVGYDIGHTESDPYQIVISKTKSDDNGYIIIKKVILGQPLSNSPINGRSEIALKDVTENYKPILFRIDNTKANNLGEHKNLIVDKQIILEYFEQKDTLFKKTWDLFKKLSKCEKYYMGKPYLLPDVSKLKENMLIELYKDSPFGKNVISTFKNNDKKMIDYVGGFIRKHENVLK